MMERIVMTATITTEQTEKQQSSLSLQISGDELKRQELGQFPTPDPIANFMASFFLAHSHELNVLDAGAGVGALSAALVRRFCTEHRKPKRISIAAYELDSTLIGSLRETLRDCQRECERTDISFSATVFNQDFIEAAIPMVSGDLFGFKPPVFNAAIMNPPYRKIRNDSGARLLLRSAGIETSNLYTGFLALVTKLLVDDGEIVAITPRSFCNGPYFKPFRMEFLETMALQRLHIFESRSAAFSANNVLQENIIFHAIKGVEKPKEIIVSSSSGEANIIIRERRVPFCEIVSPNDPDQFIHLVSEENHFRARSFMNSLPATLADLNLSVSTGRVVDFRAKSFLRDQPENGTVPLIYPCHFNGGFVHWPKEKCRKPNAIISNKQTKDLLVPAGIYVLVKRFTAKEERRRIVACLYDPNQIRAALVGFENHLNYFHIDGHGLTMNFAKGLSVFLNSSMVDNYFRQFNGHTQVNATDLRSLKYPTKEQLERLGDNVALGIDQKMLDELIEKEFNVRS